MYCKYHLDEGNRKEWWLLIALWYWGHAQYGIWMRERKTKEFRWGKEKVTKIALWYWGHPQRGEINCRF